MKLLLIEDEIKVANFVAEGLREEDFAVQVARDGEEGLYQALNFEFDLILLDILLPRIDGWEILKRLRAAGRTTRVLMLTARDEVNDRVRGLEGGADDYLTKPFSFEELLARVRALLRRGREATPDVLTLGDVTLDPRQHMATSAGRELPLSPKEFAILEYLLRRPGQVVSRTELAEHVWDENFESFSNVIDVTVHHLRDKLEAGGKSRLLHTVRGVGYVLRAEAT